LSVVPVYRYIMSFGVFMHRADSVYDDSPAEQYQFPAQYLSRAAPLVGNWIIYLEPRKVPGTRGYFAVAKVDRIVPDPSTPAMYLALMEPGSYLDFANPVAFSGAGGVIETGLLNEHGKISGRAQSAVRPLSVDDFNSIVSRGLAEVAPQLPRVGEAPQPGPDSLGPIFEQDRDRVAFLGSRIIRDRVFRRVVLRAYGERCAVTGLKLINGGGRAEVEAAHIRPVEHNGPDDVRNGIALSGTVHWMFDRGLISLSDDLEVLVSRQANDAGSIRNLINASGRARLPHSIHQRPHPHFLQWHRENCFKA
jgi:putative restriction endonuclease